MFCFISSMGDLNRQPGFGLYFQNNLSGFLIPQVYLLVEMMIIVSSGIENDIIFFLYQQTLWHL